MSVEVFPDGIEPDNPDATIWRYLDIWKFERLLDDGGLYFRRADLFLDKYEGLMPANRSLFELNEIQQWNHDNASNAQFREGFFVNCWNLSEDERVAMWEEYARTGVAIVARYDAMKSALASAPLRAFLGLVRYGGYESLGGNILRLISNKQLRYSQEREVRALLWLTEHVGSGLNRHFDDNNFPHPLPLTPPGASVPDGVTVQVDLSRLITRVVVSPWADEATLAAVEQRLRDRGVAAPVVPSDLTRYRALLPARHW